MTNTGGTPAGWYYAPGDPEGTHRYWDGAQWIGDPQPLPQQQTPTPPAASGPPTDDLTVHYRPPTQESVPPSTGFDAPGGQSAGGQQPDPQAAGGFGSPGSGQTAGAAPDYSTPGGQPAGGVPPNFGAPMSSPPPGYQGFSSQPGGPGTPAEWGVRAVAYLIDIAPMLAVYAVIVVANLLNDVLGVLVSLVGFIAIIGYVIWNFYMTQGSTGQTIGKEKQGIKLIKDDTGQPVGGGMAFARYLIIGVLALVTCGIYGLLDVLWPLWDPEKKRLTDKMLNMSVVTA